MSARFQILAPLVTPYAADGSVDTRSLAAHASALAEEGIDGFFVCGTNGEGPLLTDDEIVAATRAIATAVPGREVIPQVGRISTHASQTLLARCVDAGATAVAVVTPYYYALSEDALCAHYETLIRASGDTPLHAYAIPAYARNDLVPRVVAHLAERGLAGIKDSTKSLDRHRAYTQIMGRGRFRTFVGSDDLVLAACKLGSSGAIPAIANVRPDLLAKLVAAAVSGDDSTAARLQHDVTAARASLRDGGLGALKAAVAAFMAARGAWYSEAVRSPLATGPQRPGSSSPPRG